MTLDTRSRSAADEAKSQFDEIDAPEPRSVVQRLARRRRGQRAFGSVMVVAAISVVVIVAAVVRGGSKPGRPEAESPSLTLPKLTKHFLYGGVDFAYGFRPQVGGGYCIDVKSRLSRGGVCGGSTPDVPIPVVGTLGLPAHGQFLLALVRPDVARITLGPNGSTNVKPPDPGDPFTFVAFPLQTTAPFRLLAYDANGTQISFYDIDPRPRGPQGAAVDPCNAKAERRITRGRVEPTRGFVGPTSWRVTADASAQHHRAVFIVYIEGLAVASDCVDPDSWKTLVEKGPVSWQTAHTQGSRQQPITVVSGIVPYEATEIQVTLDTGRVIRVRPTGGRLGLPFRYFATAIADGRRVMKMEATNEQHRVVVSSKYMAQPETASDVPQVFPPGLTIVPKIEKSVVHLPLRRPGS